MVVKLTVQYDGTGYCGWQVQPNGISVQQRLEEALFILTGEKISVTGSGRTDSGVHAAGQVASFAVENSTIPAENFSSALNGLLPPDIRVIKSEAAADNFNARFSAKRKTYVYRVYESPATLPLKDRYAVRVNLLDVNAMKAAAAYIVGEHDFKCFLAANSSVKDTVRTVYALEIAKNGGDITFTVCGNGFLYNMVRIIAGTLVAVGEGRLSAGDVKKIIDGGERSNAGRTMPARGLTLVSVEYD